MGECNRSAYNSPIGSIVRRRKSRACDSARIALLISASPRIIRIFQRLARGASFLTDTIASSLRPRKIVLYCDDTSRNPALALSFPRFASATPCGTLTGVSSAKRCMLLLFIFILGSIHGSFIALLADRYLPGKSFPCSLRALVIPPSSCTQCHHPLAWFELIPVISFIGLLGACRYCRQALPVHLLYMEILTGLFWLSVSTIFPSPFQWAAALLNYSLLCLLASTDRRYMLLPDGMVFILLWSGLLLSPVFTYPDLYSRLLGVCCGYLFLYVINLGYRHYRYREGIGEGDMKLLAAIGAWNGWQSLAPVIIIASAYALCELIYRRTLMTSFRDSLPLPFGYFLSIAGACWFLVQNLPIRLPAL